MKSRLVILICSYFCLTFIFIGCSDNSVTSTGTNYTLDTASFTYPFKDGSTWNFHRKYSAFNFRPDSVKRHFSNLPLYANGTTTILYDTLINGITTKCFFITYTENSHPFDGREYYGNYDSGLVCYGYRSAFGAALTPFRVKGIHYSHNGNTFGSFQELFFMYENNCVTSATPNDTLILEVPPVVCLKYPEVSGIQWFFKSIDGFDIIYKKYIGFEKIMCGIGYYSCMKTQRIWNTMPDLELFDYYSKVGILKKDYTIKDIMVVNELGSLIGYVDMNDLYTVTSFNIPSE